MSSQGRSAKKELAKLEILKQVEQRNKYSVITH